MKLQEAREKDTPAPNVAQQTSFSTRFLGFMRVPPALMSGRMTKTTLTTMILLTSATITLATKE